MKPIARKDDLVLQEMEEEILVYDLRTDKAICLNQTSALVWQNCDGKKTVAEIAGNLEKRLDAPVDEKIVRFALSKLKEANLLENKEGLPDHFKGISRRQVIREIGLTSMVAIPVVASLVAPLAVHAQSACNTGATCTCTISGMDAGGAGMACTAAANTGGCNGFPGCRCLATSSGVPVSPGVCGML